MLQNRYNVVFCSDRQSPIRGCVNAKTASVAEGLSSTKSITSSPVTFSKYIVRISSDVSDGIFYMQQQTLTNV